MKNMKLVQLVYPPERHLIQKNWSVIINNQDLYMIIYINPLTIVKPDLKSGLCSLFYKQTENIDEFPDNRRFWKLSTHSILFEKKENICRYLIFIHDGFNEFMKKFFGWNVIYEHKLVILDFNFKELTYQLKISKPFNLEKRGHPKFHYISGASLYGSNKIIITYGQSDKKSKYVIIELNHFNQFFNEQIFE